MAIVSFASAIGDCHQQVNPGGARNVRIILAKDIVGNWPNVEVVDENDVVTELPTLVATKKWAHYLLPDGTADAGVDDSGDPGYQSWKQTVELALAGASDAVKAEIKKMMNAGCLLLIEDKDGRYQVCGTTDDPIYLKKSWKLGKKGNDKRGWTLKGEVDGLPFGLIHLDATLLVAATFATEPTY